MRRLAYISALLVVTACGSGFERARAKLDNPARSELTGKTCDVFRDATGLMHTRGPDELAAYACFGYLHGRERAFQIDYLRRAGQGRLAEILGWSAVKGDFFLRLLGLGEKAEALANGLPAEERKRLWAYTEGVNRGLGDALKAGVYEFRRLGYEPEPWRPADTLTILMLQSFHETQASFWQRTKEETRRQKLGEIARELYRRDGLPWDTSILKPGEYPTAPAAARGPRRDPGRDVRDGFLFPAPPMDTPSGTGSNSWVLTPALSAGGKAWLANDPHLDMQHPPFWHWVHVEGGDLDVVGGSVPGVPIIPSGFNRRVAWGLTDSYIDVGEIVSVPAGETRDFASQRPVIWVKLGPVRWPMFFKTFQRSPGGWPVLPIDAPAGRALVLRWTGLLVRPEGIAGFGALMNARDVQEADAFFRRFDLPTWNFVFADTAGNVGYRVVGRLPRQETPPAFGVRDARIADLEPARWPLMADDEKPHALNPPRGSIVTANNRQWPPDGRLSFGRAHREGFRAYRIEKLLGARPKHDFASQSAIQCDTLNNDASFLVPKLLAFVDRLAGASPKPPARWGEREKAALTALRGWDYTTGPDCTACAVYERWMDRILDDAGLDLGALFRVLDAPGPHTAKLTAALPDALDDLGVKDTLPRYEQVHRTFFPHLSRDARFDVPDSIFTAGNPNAVNPAGKSWDGALYRQTTGASHRLLVEMTDPPAARFVLGGSNADNEAKPVAQSGGPWLKWRDCAYEKVAYPFDWSSAKADKVAF